MGFLFGGNTGETQESITDDRKRLALAMLQQGLDTSPIRSPWQGAARLADAIMGGLDTYRMNQQQQTADAQAMSAITGQPYTPPAQSPGLFSGLFGHGKGVPASSGAQSEVAATNPSSSAAITPGNPNDIQTAFLDTVKNGYDVGNGQKLGVTNPYGLAAIAATGQAESGYSPQNAGGTWNDGVNNAGGIMSWNGPRLANLQKFAGGSNGTPQQQGQFFLQENPELIAKLNAAKSVEEAQNLMNNAWAFKGYNVPGNANAAHRLALANGYLPRFQQSGTSSVDPTSPASVAPPAPAAAPVLAPAPQPTQVASLDPRAGMPAIALQQGAVPPISPTAMPADMSKISTGQMQTLLGTPPQAGYRDPMVVAASPPPTAPQPPVPADAPPAARLSGALMALPTPPNGLQSQKAKALAAAMMNPNASPGVRQMAGMMLQKEMATGQTLYQAQVEQYIKQQDPEYQANLAKAQYEVQHLGQVSPDTQAQIAAQERKSQADAQNAIALADHNQQLKQGDPLQQANLAKTNAETANVGVTNDIHDYEYYRDNELKAGRTPLGPLQYQQELKKAGATTINTGDNSSKFQTKADEEGATRLGGYVSDGAGASQMLGDIQQLADLGPQIGTGKGAQIKATLGPYAQALGIDISGLGESQAYQSIIDRLAPNMRPAGAGSSSDTDVRMFLSSLPSLGNTPDGNKIITSTLAAIQQHKIAAAAIAEKAFLPTDQGGIKWQDAEDQIRKLPNPYQGFNAYRKTLSNGGLNPLPSDDMNVPTTIPGVTIKRISK